MSEENIIKRIVESRAEQSLRESLNNSKDFDITSDAHRKALENYNSMNEEQKKSFMLKSWKSE